jgi:hypothetical protein
LKTAICDETSKWCKAHYRDRLRAIVLTGSLARDEATFIEDGNGRSLLSDVDLLLICRERTLLPSTPELDETRLRIQEGLAQRGLRCHIFLGAVFPTYLQKLRPHIFAYELQVCGEVVWGDCRVLSFIPTFSRSELPLEDAWRLLCNRMIEQIEGVSEPGDNRRIACGLAAYRTMKLYLDMATSYLLFAGAYEPTYRQRAEILRVLARDPSQDDAPFPLEPFATRVSACTQLKLTAAVPADFAYLRGDGPESGGLSLEKAARYAQLLWRWELTRLTGARAGLADRVLMMRWMRLQPLPHRLRGWAYVLRKRAWHRSWRDWPRWTQRAWFASPRYWVYAVASELFFQLPRLLAAEGRQAVTGIEWEHERRLLPVARRPDASHGQESWRRLASDVVWNYHEFLEGTRA